MKNNYEQQQESSQDYAPPPTPSVQPGDQFTPTKMTAQLIQLGQHIRNQDSTIRRLQKEIDMRVTESALIEAIALVGAGMHADPNIVKQLKGRHESQEQETDKVKINAMALSKKLNQVWEGETLLLSMIKKTDTRLSQVDKELSGQLMEKTSRLEMSLEQTRSEQGTEMAELQQKMEILSSDLSDKMREVDTRVSWKLNEFKNKLNDKMNEQLVTMHLSTMEKKMHKEMREYQLSLNIDPKVIDSMQKDIEKNRLDAQHAITECIHHNKELSNSVEKELMRKDQFNELSKNVEERLENFYNNFTQVYTRVKNSEQLEVGMTKDIDKLLKDDESAQAELKRINKILLNLKIGEDFQKMLEQMDPTKVLELQNKVDEVQRDQGNIFHEIGISKREIDKVKAKAEIMGVMVPNQAREKMRKEEISEAIDDFLTENHFAAKILTMEKHVSEQRNSIDSIALLSKQVARLQKESDTHRLSLQIRGLEEYFKREMLLVQKQIQESRPNNPVFVHNKETSNSSEVSPIGQAFYGRSFSVRKMGSGVHAPLSSSRYRVSREASRKGHREG